MLLPVQIMAQTDGHNFITAKNMDVFTSIYKNLDLAYVDSLDADEVIGNGIKAMLRSLDPYTEYYTENDMQRLKTMLTGKYAGIGSIIRENTQEGCCMISQPYKGMPAEEVGLKKGDLILSIDDSTMVGKPTDYVSSHLRGDAGSTFQLKIRRPSTGKEMLFKITRRSIQMPAVTYYGLQPNGIGYLELNSFTEGCAKDVRRAFIEMKQLGMKGLVLDLRGNGGGSVQEAVQIVNMFVPRDITVLTMRGKINRSNKDFKTTVEPIDTQMPIVVLVNDDTASASEITSGALQDLDRAIILGTRTYGKGLVQTTVDLPYNGAMKLTTGKYYIPSGRCIQAINYKHARGGYTEHVADSLTKVFYTAGGREVRDGGGIKPDIELKADSITNLVYYLMNTRDSAEVLHHFEMDFIAKHPTIAAPDEFEISDEDFEDLKRRIVENDFKYDRQTEKFLGELVKLATFEGYYEDAKEEFAALEKKLKHDVARDVDINKALLKEMVSRELVRNYYYDEGALQHSLRYDKQVQEAYRLILSPEEYNKILKK